MPKMPRKKKGGYTAAFEVNTSVPEGAPRLALLVSPNCPFCKKVLTYSVTRHYLSKGILAVYDISKFPNAGDWVLTEGGLVYRLVTPMFVVLCGNEIIHKAVPANPIELEGFVRAVVYTYLSTYINTQCSNNYEKHM